MSTATFDTRRPSGESAAAASQEFVLFVEGPRDRHILRSWAHRISPLLARRLVAATVILGGRQPARAVRHMRELAESGRPARGLCVLDRDTDGPGKLPSAEGLDLELHTWQRRHIEAYLLVPEAIRRGLRVRDRGLDRLLRGELPALDDEAALARVDAKRLFDRRGTISMLLGRRIDLGRIARAMREDELPTEARTLLDRIGHQVGVKPRQVIVRWRAGH